MTQDVPDKSRDSSDMHEIERIHELMQAERDAMGVLDLSSGNDDSSSKEVRTVATNTTR